MTLSAIFLVVLAAVFHACWNLLTKRSHNKPLFLWWTGVIGSPLLLPAVLWSVPAWHWSPRVWVGVGAAALLRASYFASLGAAYARGDLSVVYPLARGTAVVLVAPIAMAFLGERPALVGGVGVGIVALGVYMLHLPALTGKTLLAPFRALATPGAAYATLTGLITATYSVVDKWVMAGGFSPILYAYLTIPVAALLLTPFTLRDRKGVAAEWQSNRLTIPVVSFLMTVGYVLVLIALRLSPVSYVAPTRELSIVIGAFLGSVVLREGYLPQRLAGAGLIVLGVFFLAAAPESS